MEQTRAINCGSFAVVYWGRNRECCSVLRGDADPESFRVHVEGGEMIYSHPTSVTHVNQEGKIFHWGRNSQHLRQCLSVLEEHGESVLLSRKETRCMGE